MRFLYTIVFTFSCFALMAQTETPKTTGKSTVDLSNLKRAKIATSSAYNTNRQAAGIPLANRPLLKQLKSGPQVNTVAKDGMPTIIQGALPNQSSARSREQKVFHYLEAIKSPIQIEAPAEEFQVINQRKGVAGKEHIKLQQFYKGLKVYGGEAILHTDRSGAIELFSGRNFPSPSIKDVQPSIDATDAIALAINHVAQFDNIVKEYDSPNAFIQKKEDHAELVIYHIEQDIEKERLAWALNIHPNKVSHWKYFIDAKTGEILEKYKTLCQLHHGVEGAHPSEETIAKPAEIVPFGGPESTQATDLNGAARNITTYNDNGTYYLIDATKPMFDPRSDDLPNHAEGAIFTLSANNTSPATRNFSYQDITTTGNNWNSALGALGVSAHYNAGITYDYFLNTHGRNSINDRGSNVVSFVNVSEDDGSSMENAFWDGQYIYYGNGGNTFKELARSLDVAGHEIAHGVVQTTANLEYQGESGAMNESFADIFAIMITRDNWAIGEEVVNTNVFRGGALRNLADPNNGGSSLNTAGWQPKNTSEQFRGSEDNGGVHINSGITNHAFYLYTTSSLLGDDVNANALITEKVFYKALTDYLTARSQFRDLRAAVILSARDLYGAQSAAVSAADQAFRGVGINSPAVGDILNTMSAPPTQESEPEEVEANVGTDYVVFTDEATSKLYVQVAGGDIVPLSEKGVKSRPSITDDGSVMLYVGSDNTINQITIDWETGTFTEEVLDEQQIWRNVAISRDGRRLAALTEETDETFKDNIIYVIDLVLSDSKAYELYNPTYTQGITTGAVEFADAIEFDFSGENVLYDAFNSINSTFGESDFSYWDIGFIKVWENDINFWEQDEETNIRKLYSGLPEDDSVGNPTFSKNSPDVIAFDYIENFNNDDPTDDNFYLLGANILTSKLDTILLNGELNFPSYSRTDEQIIFNATANNDAKVIASIPLADSKITSTGNAAVYVNQTEGAQLGVWFSNGTRTFATSLNDLATDIAAFTINPNPFSDQIRVDFQTETAQILDIKMTNLLGQQVYADTEKAIQGANQFQLGLGELMAGTYLLTFTSEKGIISRKIVKK